PGNKQPSRSPGPAASTDRAANPPRRQLPPPSPDACGGRVPYCLETDPDTSSEPSSNNGERRMRGIGRTAFPGFAAQEKPPPHVLATPSCNSALQRSRFHSAKGRGKSCQGWRPVGNSGAKKHPANRNTIRRIDRNLARV